jgi:hypothetical protein
LIYENPGRPGRRRSSHHDWRSSRGRIARHARAASASRLGRWTDGLAVSRTEGLRPTELLSVGFDRITHGGQATVPEALNRVFDGAVPLRRPGIGHYFDPASRRRREAELLEHRRDPAPGVGKEDSRTSTSNTRRIRAAQRVFPVFRHRRRDRSGALEAKGLAPVHRRARRPGSSGGPRRSEAGRGGPGRRGSGAGETGAGE